MSSDEREQILKVLSGAIIRETNAFNFYYEGSENEALPPGARGLLSRLAEEERVHRQLLVDEFKAIEKGWSGRAGEEGEPELAYEMPEKPTLTPLKLGERLDAAALTMPSRLVGGDNIFSRTIRDHGGESIGTLLLLYDAMGHGMKTTGINALAAKAVGEYIDSVSLSRMETVLLAPKKIAGLLNRKIAERYEGEGIFLTVICVLFDCRERKLTYTSAGHEPPFLVDSSGKASSLLQTQLIAGIDPAFHYRERSIPFGEDDIFCIFSDGIVEAENADGVIFGRSGVSSFLEDNSGKKPEEIVTAILSGLRHHLEGMPLRDEVSLIVVKPKGE
jgi:sigma-B regulation protein RsbU (phosphoserine phosphatase)